MTNSTEPPNPSKRSLRRTAITAGVFALVLSARHAGFMVLLFAIPLLLWMAYAVRVAIRVPERRVVQLWRVGMWCFAVAVVLGVHLYLHVSTRARADAVAQVVKRYMAENGRCPDADPKLGLDAKSLRDRLGISYFACTTDGPMLSYAATFVPFEMYRYDFASGVWGLEGR